MVEIAAPASGASSDGEAVAPVAAAPSRRRKPQAASPEQAGPPPIPLRHWRCCTTRAHADGSSPRFATLDGPQPLTVCGSPLGYGWYRVAIKSKIARARLMHWPDCADRVHLYHHGALARVTGFGPGAKRGPFELKIGAGEQVLVALADNFGRVSEGNESQWKRGVFGGILEVRPLRLAKPKIARAEAVDPFTVRRFIAGGTAGQLSAATQLVWSFNHVKREPILVDVDGARASGTLVLNDKPIAYHAGESGGCVTRIMLEHGKNGALKRGKNELRFAPDPAHEHALEAMEAATTIYECLANVTEEASWAFAKWQTPDVSEFTDAGRAEMKSMRGVPCWWRCGFDSPRLSLAAGEALWLDTSGLSKGQAYLNGRNVGRYFTATGEGKHVGPQTRLYLPHPWLKSDEHNDLLIFDEHGFDPGRCRLVVSARGELD